MQPEHIFDLNIVYQPQGYIEERATAGPRRIAMVVLVAKSVHGQTQLALQRRTHIVVVLAV